MSANDPPRRPRAPGIPDRTLPPPRLREESDPDVLERARERQDEEARQAAERARSRARRPEVVPESPPSEPPSQKGGIRLPKGSPWIAYVLLAAISTGAGGGLVEALRPKGPSSEQIEDLRAEVRALRADQREILDHLRRSTRVEQDRDELQAEWICLANGGSWVRGFQCGALASAEPVPLGSSWIGPRFKLRAEWPLASRPP